MRWNVAGAVAAHQILAVRRQGVLVALVGCLAITSALAGLLGWSSNHTIVRVFDEAVKLQAATGKPAPPNPFLLKPSLSLLSNMVVYIPLLGALFAVVLGHLSIVEDEANGLGRLLFSRHISRTQYAVGKVLSAASVLAIMLGSSLVISALSVAIVNTSLTGADLARLAAFYALSWLYLMSFALIGMVAVLINHRRTLALLTAMGTWLVITFAVPQFTSGLRPTQSLNPIVETPGSSQPFFQATAHAQPFSVVEQYKSVAAEILQTAPPAPSGELVVSILPIAGLVVLLLLILLRLVHRHDFSRSASND
jgi:ABC-type transport system involved in multi-copper enzyme maturation permease subunit